MVLKHSDIQRCSIFGLQNTSYGGLSKYDILLAIKKLRELKGLKQDFMAERLKMSQSAYSRLEKDEIKMDLDTLEQVSEIFEMRVEDILRFDEKVSYYINNNQNSHAANGGVNYGVINDIDTFNKLLVQINDRIERQWKEIEELKNKISNIKKG